MLSGMFAGVFTLPITVMLFVRARRNPTRKLQYARTMILMPIMPLGIVLYAGYKAEKNFTTLSDKYFGHLTDTDLDNFEIYYQMAKQQ
jgi:hypothetical protein